MKPEIWAHRGASFFAPENTLPAFSLAADMGADGVEFDIQLTKDGEIVVIHDEKVDRTTDGQGYVKDFSLAEIKKLNAAKSGGFVEIPTLTEVFELLRPTTLRINVEFKTGIVYYDSIEEKAFALAEKFGLVDRILWSSFNHYSCQKVKELSELADIALLSASGIFVTAEQCKSLGASAMHPNIRQLHHPRLVEDCDLRGVKLRVWTVDKPDDFRLAIQQKVDGIFTNRIDMAKEALGIR